MATADRRRLAELVQVWQESFIYNGPLIDKGLSTMDPFIDKSLLKERAFLAP
jgi:hypothetical protein